MPATGPTSSARSRSVFFGARKACPALAAAVTFASGLAGIAVFLLSVRQVH